jgi:hypothetical protein
MEVYISTTEVHPRGVYADTARLGTLTECARSCQAEGHGITSPLGRNGGELLLSSHRFITVLQYMQVSLLPSIQVEAVGQPRAWRIFDDSR